MHYSRLKRHCFVIFIISLVCVPVLQANDDTESVPRITFITGQVQFQSTPETDLRDATVGQTVSVNSTIATQDKSVAIVTLPDLSQVKINANSRILFDEVTPGTQKSPASTVITLESGSVFSAVPKQAIKPKFMIRTKAAVMTVSGTGNFSAFGWVRSSNSDIWMCVHEGEVAVESLKNSKTVIIKKGEGILIPAGGKSATLPKPYRWTKKLNWNMDPDQGEVRNKTVLPSAYKDLLGQAYD